MCDNANLIFTGRIQKMALQGFKLNFKQISDRVKNFLAEFVTDNHSFQAVDEGGKFLNVLFETHKKAQDCIPEKAERIKGIAGDFCDLGKCDECKMVKEENRADCPVLGVGESISNLPNSEIEEALKWNFYEGHLKELTEFVTLLICAKHVAEEFADYLGTVLKDSRIDSRTRKDADTLFKRTFAKFQNSVAQDVKTCHEFPIGVKVVVKGLGTGFIPDEALVPQGILDDRSEITAKTERPTKIVALNEIFGDDDPRFDALSAEDKRVGDVLKPINIEWSEELDAKANFGTQLTPEAIDLMRESLKVGDGAVLCIVPTSIIERA